MLFVDVDGTLLDSAQRVSGENLSALSACRASGIRVILASGRPPGALLLLSQYVPMDSIVVSLNGGIVVDLASSRVMAEWPLIPQLVDEVVEVADRTGAKPCLYTASEWYVRAVDEKAVLEVKRSGLRPRIASELRGFDLPVLKVLLIAEPGVLAVTERALRDSLGDELQIGYSYPEYLEITGRSVSKATACEVVLRSSGLRWRDAMAIGDSTNDISMVGSARIGVAMGNSGQELLSVAGFRTATNEENGVAAAIRGLIFGEADACEHLVVLCKGGLV